MFIEVFFYFLYVNIYVYSFIFFFWFKFLEGIEFYFIFDEFIRIVLCVE